MPVYVRRRQAVTPDTLAEFSTDEEDFITDPDQCRDLLPQPYRLVVKLLDSAVDDIWEVIAARESDRVAEQQRQLPPQYDSGGALDSLRRVNCLCASPDNEFVFVGQSDGVAAFRAGRHAEGLVDDWQCSEYDITALNCSLLSDGVYILAANDDMGIARLFAFAGDRFLLLKVMNDTEGDKKIIAAKIDLSSTSDFCGLALENPGSGESWLEVHRLPKDAWVKEMDSIVNARRQAAAKRAAAAQEEASTDEGGVQRSVTSSPVEEERTAHKFSGPSLVLRCRPPPKVSGCSATTLSTALKPVDGTGEVLGAGTVHPLTGGHLEARQMVFESLHEASLRRLPADSEPEREFQSAAWHFLANGRSLPVGLEQPQNENGAVLTGGVAVWWRGGRQLLIYSLLRPAKEVEHRPEQLLPFAAPITASCLTPCSALAAVGLASGHVALIDWHLGLTRRVLRVAPEPVWRLRFLNPRAWENSSLTADAYPPYKHRVDLQLVVVMEDKSMYTFSTGPGLCYWAKAQPVTTSDKHAHEQAAWVDTVGALPGVVVRSSHGGVLVLHDVVKGHELCRLTLPDEASLAEPWQPQLCFPVGAKTMYIRGQRPVKPNEEAAAEDEQQPEEENESLLVALELSRIAELERHLGCAPDSKEPHPPAVVHPMVFDRANALLELRLHTHTDRTAKLQGRWQRLRETFKTIQERKGAMEVNGVDENDALRSVLASTPLSDVQW